jgi:hypothetical protein
VVFGLAAPEPGDERVEIASGLAQQAGAGLTYLANHRAAFQHLTPP